MRVLGQCRVRRVSVIISYLFLRGRQDCLARDCLFGNELLLRHLHTSPPRRDHIATSPSKHDTKEMYNPLEASYPTKTLRSRRPNSTNSRCPKLTKGPISGGHHSVIKGTHHDNHHIPARKWQRSCLPAAPGSAPENSPAGEDDVS
jgi:hypothetical protein